MEKSTNSTKQSPSASARPPLYTPHHYNSIAKALREGVSYEARILVYVPLRDLFARHDPNFDEMTFAMRLLTELPDFVNDSTD